MMEKVRNTGRVVALIVLVSFATTACYNRHFITTKELEKLESDVDPKETVTVYADCDGALSGETGKKEKKSKCEKVVVSGTNALTVVMKDGTEHRVTPFNFTMSERQLVSPEYDKLLKMSDIKGAEVREFSTWKTIGTIVGVSAAAIGTFVTISLVAPEGGFQQ